MKHTKQVEEKEVQQTPEEKAQLSLSIATELNEQCLRNPETKHAVVRKSSEKGSWTIDARKPWTRYVEPMTLSGHIDDVRTMDRYISNLLRTVQSKRFDSYENAVAFCEEYHYVILSL